MYGSRPCPFVSCRYHLYIDIKANGGFVVQFADREPWDLPQTCALDVADKGGHTLEEVGNIIGVTRERVRQLEEAALDRLREEKEKLEEWKPAA